MVTEPTPHPDSTPPGFLADRRSAADRRAGAERRQADRRVLQLPVEHERRSGERRLSRDRRAQDRRVPPAAQFSWDETRVIQAMLLESATTVACPRCRGNLLIGPVESHDGLSMREVHCTGCRNSVVIVG